ncbi:protein CHLORORESPIRATORY REDUCTION 41, chloroplastic [Vitis vinifera]|uniref:protein CHLORORESPIRATORY REDUCTION 41, chloroplastic n=1 Tax=Vitis vinifera TaxID=29760 RepID=UPI00053FCE40|nr:protein CHLORORESPIRATORY REDUCTION 41, chloroplastic [Vitis vinifera]|eukprot:XP_002279843.2 PREDICTED: uncharacterized protein LOC100258940 [Vitis vinifera]
MASTFLRFITHVNPLLLHHNQPSQTSNSLLRIHHLPNPKPFTVNCTTPPSSPDPPDFPNPYPNSDTTNNVETFPIEKRRKSEIIRDRKARTKLEKPEPPNFEVGWKRSKVIELEKPKGYVIADFLEKLEELMGREFGSTELLAKTGEIVAERAREEAEVLRDEGEVDERLVTELFRVLRLMEMDLAMVKAAVKEETLSERLKQAKARNKCWSVQLTPSFSNLQII